MENGPGGLLLQRTTTTPRAGTGLLEQPAHLLHQGDLQGYASWLTHWGIDRYLRLELPGLITHLQPLDEFPADLLTPRLVLLQTVTGPQFKPKNLEQPYTLFSKTGDTEAAAVCIGGAIRSILDSGRDFDRFFIWTTRAAKLIDRLGHQPLILAFLLFHGGWAEIMGRGDIMKVHGLLGLLADSAEQAGSESLLLGYGSLSSHIAFWRNNLAAQEIVLDDLEPFAVRNRAAPAALLEYYSCRGLLLTLKGDSEAGRKLLEPLLDSPEIGQLPPASWLEFHGNYLYMVASQADGREIERVAALMRNSTIPVGRHYHHAYLHFCLAVASLVQRRPYKALLHARECRERGRRCGSTNAIRMSALVCGQALVDLDRHEEAATHFEEWIPRWREAGYYILCSQGCLEMAWLMVHAGRLEQARHYLNKARSKIAKNERLPTLHRPSEFILRLEEKLRPIRVRSEPNPIRTVDITTLGNFAVRVDGRKIYDREWHGRLTRKLLKAVIAFGSTQVPVEPLAGLLWSDADGDRAMNSFKVTLSRLRKIVMSKDPALDRWIVVKQKQISLVDSLTSIDIHVFENKLRHALHSVGDRNLITSALDLYRGNFLEYNDEPWTVERRRQLQEMFIHGVFQLCDMLARAGLYEEITHQLCRARQLDPLNEEIYLRLIAGYLESGNRAKALTTYREAIEIIFDTLGTAPGSRLRHLGTTLGLT